MKNINNFIEVNINEARITWENVHDAILNVCWKYMSKPGVSGEVKEYCDKVRNALDSIKK